MTTRSLILAAGMTFLPACAADTPTNPEAALAEGAALTRVPGDPGAAADRSLFKVHLSPLGGSRATGEALIEVVDGFLRVRIHAAGVEPGEHIPQHIHLNPGCNPGGGILVNLDAGLTVPGEGANVGPSFPSANLAGVMNYEATRSLDALRSALNTFGGLALDDAAELLDYLDLENRNVHMHVAFGPPFPAVNCGGVERVN
ncbi:MAG TPA: hypothetical protein VFT04_14805 [Gemmatimonadales bacterium]|nr:hypothetical protein [Gemmatimonadales bacterium]